MAFLRVFAFFTDVFVWELIPLTEFRAYGLHVETPVTRIAFATLRHLRFEFVMIFCREPAMFAEEFCHGTPSITLRCVYGDSYCHPFKQVRPTYVETLKPRVVVTNDHCLAGYAAVSHHVIRTKLGTIN
jgi:hypothetical protein